MSMPSLTIRRLAPLQDPHRQPAMPRTSASAALPASPVLHRGGAPAQRLLPLRPGR